MEQWRISLKNSKGRRGHERDVEAEEVVHLPPVITHPSINNCEEVHLLF